MNSFDEKTFLRYAESRRGSLLVIFLFTTGLLAILVTGLYYLVNISTMQQAQVEQFAKKQMIERALEKVHAGELDRLTKDYVSNGTIPSTGVAYDSSSYQTALAAAENWAFPTTTQLINPGSVTVASWPTDLPFSKSNPTTATDSFLEHPLSFAYGRLAEGSLSGTYTPAWNNTSFTYTRNFACYKEIPVVQIPFLAVYKINNYAPLDTITFSSANSTQAVLLGGDATHNNPTVGASLATISSAPSFSNLSYTFGLSPLPPEAVASYRSATGTPTQQTLQTRQMYCLDSGSPSVTVINFTSDGTLSGSSLSSTPTGFTIETFDKRPRVIIDMSTADRTAVKKYYIYCTSALAMAGGVVLKDTSSTDESSTTPTTGYPQVSVATNGMMYLWNYGGSRKRRTMAATSYGAVGLASAAGYDGTTASAALSFSAGSVGVSAISKRQVWIYDDFNRNGQLDTTAKTLPTPDGITIVSPTNTEVTSWSSTASANKLTCSTTGGGQVTGGYAWVSMPLGNGPQGLYTTYPYGGGMIGFFVTTSVFPSNVGLRLWMANVENPLNDSNRIGITFLTDTSGNIKIYLGSGSEPDPTRTFDGNATNVFGCFYAPGTRDVFVTLNGSLMYKTRLSPSPDTWVPSYVAFYPHSASIIVKKFSVESLPLGTLITTPQSSIAGAGSASFSAGLTVGDGIAASISPLGTTGSINFNLNSAVAQTLEKYCERVIVHYPYFYKP